MAIISNKNGPIQKIGGGGIKLGTLPAPVNRPGGNTPAYAGGNPNFDERTGRTIGSGNAPKIAQGPNSKPVNTTGGSFAHPDNVAPITSN